MNFYNFHIGDFRGATRHLTVVERALYRECIDEYMDTERPLDASDFDRLARRLLANSEVEKEALRAVLAEFFVLEGAEYIHLRCAAELEKYQCLRASASRAGQISAAKRAKKKVIEQPSNECSTGVEQPYHQPRTKNQEPRATTKVVEDATEKPKKSGTRLPPDWRPDGDLIQWTIKERPDLVIQKTVDQFVDYWTAKAGKDAAKMSWPATFRNWVRAQRREHGAAGGQVETVYQKTMRERVTQVSPHIAQKIQQQQDPMQVIEGMVMRQSALLEGQ